MFVVKVSALTEFCQEVPAGKVRLSQCETLRAQTPIPIAALCVDLQGFNADGELIWLHKHYEIQLTPGSQEPWTEQGRALYTAFPVLSDLLKAYLLTRGYDVHPGTYGLAAEIHPLNGTLEVVRWDPDLRTFALHLPEAP